MSTKKSNESGAVGATVPDPQPDFEKALAELETIVQGLEQGELSLEESLRQFERGVSLTRVCQASLKQAEHKVEILLRAAGPLEESQLATFDTEEPDDD